jgi:hypothetical protein
LVERLTLSFGASGPFVRDLQLALNARLSPSPNLVVNGSFNEQTKEAVLAFQEANWLHLNGHCEQATLDCLYGAEAHAPIQHNLRFQGSPIPGAGWAAMLAMLRGTKALAVVSNTPADLAAAYTDRTSSISAEARQTLARLHGVTLHPGLGLTVSRLVEALRQGPVGLERLSDLPGRGKTASRFVVAAAARGSHGADGAATTLRIYDPEQQIAIYSQSYAGLLRSQPGTRFVMFTRQG